MRTRPVRAALGALLAAILSLPGTADAERPPTQAVLPSAAAPVRRQAGAAKLRGRAKIAKEAPCGGLSALPRRAGPRPFGVGEELDFELTVAGALVGRMETKVGKPRQVEGKTMLPLFGRARTSAVLAAFQPFLGRYMAMVHPESLEPLGVRVESTYGKEDRWERVRFSPDRRGVEADFTLGGQELHRSYRSDHGMTDVLTMLYLGRMLAYSEGVSGCQDVFGSRRLWRMTGSVRGLVQVDTPIGERPAFHVSTILERRPTEGLDSRKPPRVRLDVFYATDAAQTPLAFEVETEGVVGRGKLVRWSKGGQSAEAEWTPAP
jgi:hypothetical protein